MEQVKKAIGWANTYLESPIEARVAADSEGLLKRLAAIEDNGIQLLKTFYGLTRYPLDMDMGNSIRKIIEPEMLAAYYRR